MSKHDFRGGVLIENPYPLKQLNVVEVPPPKKAIFLLKQREGASAKPKVKVVQKVKVGQVIAVSNNDYCVPMHSSISGVVSAIDDQPIAHSSGLKVPSISIESDGKDDWITFKGCGEEVNQCRPDEIIAKIRNAGIVGMGGAGFPAHIKIKGAQGAKTIIINATECDPATLCDDALMRKYPEEIIKGIEVLIYACQSQKVAEIGRAHV